MKLTTLSQEPTTITFQLANKTPPQKGVFVWLNLTLSIDLLIWAKARLELFVYLFYDQINKERTIR